MKHLTILLSIFLFSCTDSARSGLGISVSDNRPSKNELKPRIVGKEYTVYNGVGYQIIEIDNIEYLSITSGGVIPLKK